MELLQYAFICQLAPVLVVDHLLGPGEQGFCFMDPISENSAGSSASSREEQLLDKGIITMSLVHIHLTITHKFTVTWVAW